MSALHQSRAVGKHRRPLRKSEGFTLLELLIVVVIIGVLAAIAIPAYNGYINKAQRTSAQATLDTIRKTLESYYVDYQEYPDSIDFNTGQDGLGRTVFESQFVNQINGDLSSIDSYLNTGTTYTLVVKAKDSNQTVMTLTPLEITY
jgi:prepilin-type N-terminal cleavage/methylation domain-containing protein